MNATDCSTPENNEWDSRIENAAKALGIPAIENPDPQAKTGGNSLENKLKQMGIVKGAAGLQMLEDDEVFRFGDFRESFKEHGIAVLRMAMKFLKGGKKADERQSVDERTVQLRELGFKVRIEDADTQALLKLYVPGKPNDPVTVALKKRFGDKPMIAFKDDGSVAIEETAQYAADREQGFPAQLAVMVGIKLATLWAVGVKPDTIVDEDPLYPGLPLRNYCSTVNNRNWTRVNLPNRQLCRIILERGEIDVNNKEAVLRLLERAQADTLSEAYPEADLDFRQRKQHDTLPKLKVVLGSSEGKPNNPFGVNKRY